MSKNYLQWMSQETPTIWWHDSAVQANMDAAMKNGATGMTTNPFLMASSLYADPASWADVLKDLPELTGDAKALELERRLGSYYANMLAPIYEKGRLGEGGVCAQVTPAKTGNAELMTQQVHTIATFAPNIFIKIPATKAGLVAFEEGIASGYNMVSTVSFSVPQMVAAAEAQIRGEKRAVAAGKKPGVGVAVLMVGRLDDYLRDVAADNQLNIPESDIIQAGLACMKKAYGIFMERGYKTLLMPAAGRGIYHVTELAGAKNMVMSVAPSIEKMLLEANPAQEMRIDVPIAQDVIDRLSTMAEFRKAFNEDGMAPEEFITFGPTNRTATQFVESGWNKLIQFK
ncbi:MAG: transaldolase family protein [Eubacteriales bacterium]|jgi:transaldolase